MADTSELRCVVDPDAGTFAERALPWLYRAPVENNTVCLTVQQRAAGEAPDSAGALWVRVLDGAGAHVAAAAGAPSRPLFLTAAPESAADLLAQTVHRHRPELTSVSGPYTATARFASQWRALTGNEPVETMRMRLHRLDTVHQPTGVRGTARPATTDDRTVLTTWLAAMREEALPHEPDTELGPIVDRGLARGAYWLWEDGGDPVSMLAVPSQAAGVARINAVYTPPHLRGHGYASACVAAVSQRLLDQGAWACSLLTDLANPTTNRIYQAIGYVPVGEDVSRYELS